MYRISTTLVSLLLILVIGASILFGVYISYDHFNGKANDSGNSQGNQQNPEEGNKEENKEEEKVEIPTENTISVGNTGLTLYSILPDVDPITIDNDTVLFGSDTVWTPGHAEVIYIALAHDNTVTVSYSVGLKFTDSATAKNAAGEEVKLSDLLMFGVIGNPDDVYATSADAVAALDISKPVSQNFSRVGAIEPDSADILAIVVYLPESVGELNGGEIDLGLTVFATSVLGGEEEEEILPELPESSFTDAVEAPEVNEEGATTAPVTVGSGSNISAVVPAGVKLEEGATDLTLIVDSLEDPDPSVPVAEGETAKAIDVHIAGVAEDNTVPMLITLKRLFSKGLNSTSVKMYHIEGGEVVEMTLVSNPTNHNEFSYDPTTGNVVMCVASFSEYVTVEDDYNLWKGKINTSWYNITDTTFTLTTAEQLAGFGAIVDGGYNEKDANGNPVWVDLGFSDNFDNKTIKLGADIKLNKDRSFNPIGFGYDNADFNSGDKPGFTFNGTFDGQGHTITDLYVNGWDIGISYSNSGGGLFASVCNATIKNLTMVNANVVMECVEQGVIAGLAQGNCIFENININNCSVANYQRATGGVVGEVSPKFDNGSAVQSHHIFNNIYIDSQTVVGSLWGDFDAPVGGVIGGYWDDYGMTTVEMNNVTVACRLDVYNDVTSSYQWYAYRRAGMLIGNTDKVDPNDSHKAYADFLTCSNVVVKYGDWTNYHYCEFSNHNSSWPWVRVEAGENCSAFSNPRYGVPNDINGVKVTPEHHSAHDLSIHKEGDECYVELTFNQLYGGGQGVYGQTTHEGVTIENYIYSIQYFNNDKLLAETFVKSNDSEFILTNDPNYNTAKAEAEKWVTEQGHIVEFGGWVNAGSTKITSIPARNTETIKLYPYFNSPHTARFVDQSGNVIAWCLFHKEKITALETTRETAEAALVFGEGFELDHWVVHIIDANGNVTKEDYDVNNFKNYETDVTIYPVYKFNGDVSLIPVDKDGDGDTDYYQVSGYGSKTGEQELVEIPGVVNGIPVTEINADAFSSYDDLHSVRIPGTITAINYQSFTANQGNSWNPKRDTVTLYYEGDPSVWAEAIELYKNSDYDGMLKQNWDNNMGDGSRVFFLDENGKVDNTKYWELNDKYEWVLHEHAYSYEAAKSCAHGEKSHYEYGGGFIGIGASLQKDKFTNYAGACDCDSCDGATRPDAEYWTPVTVTADEQ